MNEQQSQNLLSKVDAFWTIRNNKLTRQGEKLETSAKLTAFASNLAVMNPFLEDGDKENESKIYLDYNATTPLEPSVLTL